MIKHSFQRPTNDRTSFKACPACEQGKKTPRTFAIVSGLMSETICCATCGRCLPMFLFLDAVLTFAAPESEPTE